MKQGKADKEGKESWKVEPKNKAVSEEGIAEYGLAQGFHPRMLFAGPSFKQPSVGRNSLGPGGGRTIHPSGSQGKHK